MHLVTLGGTLVLLQDAADLPVHQLTIEASLGAGNAARQAFERKIDTLAEFVVHGRALLRRSAERHSTMVSPVSGLRASLTSTSSRTLRQPTVAASGAENFFSSDFGAPMM